LQALLARSQCRSRRERSKQLTESLQQLADEVVE